MGVTPTDFAKAPGWREPRPRASRCRAPRRGRNRLQFPRLAPSRMRVKSGRSVSSQAIHRCGSGQEMPIGPRVAGATTCPAQSSQSASLHAAKATFRKEVVHIRSRKFVPTMVMLRTILPFGAAVTNVTLR